MVAALPVPLLPFIKQEFGLDNTHAGLVISAFSLSYGLFQLPAGFLADRIGPRTMIAISITGIGLSGLLIGLTHSYVLMLIFLVLMGIAGGGYHPAAPPLLAASVPPANRGKAFVFHLIGGNSAFFLAPLMAAGIAAVWSWRGAFIGLSIPTIIFGIIFYLLIGGTIIKKTKSAAAAVTAESNDTVPPKGWVRQLVLFMILTAVVSSLSISASSFIPLFAQARFGVSAVSAAIFVAVINSSGIWASPLGGYFSDRIGNIPAVLVSSLATGPFIYLATITPYGAGFVITLLVWGALNAVRLPASESFIISNCSPKLRSSMFGIFYASAQHGTAILTPLLGYLIDRVGYINGFNIAAAITLGLTIICGAFLWSNSHPQAHQAAGN
ncbi:MAG: hypothetical protein A2144_14910 [Chloroflexi bacterium RBG_16_50_9]|nr:MAG: hypothetical protein A2144_14910 [Chloroflexi bacterium RBG_16_50_9]